MEHIISKINLSCFPNDVLESMLKAIAQEFGVCPPPKWHVVLHRHIGVFANYKACNSWVPILLLSLYVCLTCLYVCTWGSVRVEMCAHVEDRG